MRRIVSIWFPTWQTDRIRRADPDAPPPNQPIVTKHHDGRRMIVAAVDRAARAIGLQAGMPLAQAQAMIPSLTVFPATPEDDAAALRELAAHCLRWSPQTSAAAPDGIWIDTTGCDHLYGGETAMVEMMRSHFMSHGLTARVALADTAGAAHAVARYGGAPATVIGALAQTKSLAAMPVAALRLSAEAAAGLRRIGLETIEQLAKTPRAPVARRFGEDVLMRLDQALGRRSEPLPFVLPPDAIVERRTFLEPLLTADSFAYVIEQLTSAVCARLEASGLGARQLDLLFERIDNTRQVVRIGTATASRKAAHLSRLLKERIDTVDPGFGVEAMELVVGLSETFAHGQMAVSLDVRQDNEPDLSGLVDQLINRFGASKVYRIEPTENDAPERSYRCVPAVGRFATLPVARAPEVRPRPIRLLKRPQKINVLAELPDRPPAMFVWRQRQHRICFADGPERIVGEWWRRDRERHSVRDYWRVEDERGQRFWLYRRGNGSDAETRDLTWFLHGFF